MAASKIIRGTVMMIVMSACSAMHSADQIQLIVALSATPEHVMIDNGNGYVWKNAKITLNHSYIYESSVLPRGASSLNLTEFVKPDGTSFDPTKQRFTSLSIYVPNAIDGKPGVFKW